MSLNLSNFDQLWDFNHPEETEKKFRELLPIAEKSDDLSYHIQLLTQIGRTYSLRRMFDEAHQTLDQAEELLTNDILLAKIRYLLERGRTYNSAGDVEHARPLFVQAWQLANEIDNSYYAVDAAHMMGIAAPPKEQLDWNLKALQLAEKTSDERAKKWLGALYNNIGWTYHDLGEYKAALELFEKGVEWHEKQENFRPLQIAKWCVGRALRSLNHISEAYKTQSALLTELNEHNITDGYVYEELGECLLLLNRTEKATTYFGLAYDELSKDSWLVQNEPERIERLKNLGQR